MAMGPYLTIARLAAAVRFTLRHVQRSEEHTSELQSQSNLVCRLLLEKKKLPLAVRGTIPEVSRIASSHSAIGSWLRWRSSNYLLISPAHFALTSHASVSRTSLSASAI